MANLTRQYQIFIGKNVRAKREKMGVSQERLGELTGFHRTYVGMVERGEKNITILNLQRFAKALGVHVRDLIDF